MNALSSAGDELSGDWKGNGITFRHGEKLFISGANAFAPKINRCKSGGRCVVTHLNDERVQELLDGQFPIFERREIEEHLKSCDACRERVSQYEELYSTLETAPDTELSRSFARTVLRKTNIEEIGSVQFGLTQVFAALAAVIVVVNTLLYFIEWNSLKGIAAVIGKSLIAFVPALSKSGSTTLQDVDIKGSLVFIVGAVILFLLFLFDRYLLQPRFRSSN
ncbi:MAG: hypothetical protein EHM72_17545 [Calditrichaeota bacterium]|nr:MAG: hypothetical protein EHM72_17545 [Calditrichota bacterium]